MPDSKLVKAALDWAERGIPVFPCGDNKAPLTKHGFHDAEIDPTKVRALFEFYPNASLIGGKMGDGIFAVDVDLYKGDGVQEWLKANVEDGTLPDTRTHKTMNGGLHLFYEGDVGCTSIAEGIDIKGNGGYVIMPGAGGYKVLNEGLAPTSASFLDTVNAAASRSKGSAISKLKSSVLDGSDFHNALTQLAAKLASNGMDQIGIQQDLLTLIKASTASDPGNKRHSRWRKILADDGGELSRIISSAYRKFNDDAVVEEMQELSGIDFKEYEDASDKVFTVTQLGLEPELDEILFNDDKWPFEGQGYFADEDIEIQNQNFVMFPIYAENETAVMFAEPKTGKTALALTTALHISCGMDLGVLKVAKGGPCLYYALEGSRAIRLRVTSWKKKMLEDGVKLPSRIPLFVIEKSANFLKEQAREAAAAQLIAADKYSRKFGEPLKVIYIDTLTKAMSGGDQNSVEDTSDLFDIVGRLRDGGVSATIVFVHHKARSGNVRGSTNIEAEPDILLDVTKKNNVISLKVARARSIEDGGSYHFLITGVDLGKTTQGHDLPGMFVSPMEQEEVTQGEHVDVQKTAQMRNVITQLGKDGYVDAEDVLVEWTELGLIEARQSTMGKLTPKLTSAAAQEALHKVAADVGGTIYGDNVIRPVTEEKNVVGFEVGKIA